MFANDSYPLQRTRERSPAHNSLLSWSRLLVRAALGRAIGRVLPPDRFLVLGYHRVVQRFESEARRTLPASLISLGMLERHLDFIGRDHDFVTLDELARRFEQGGPTRRPLATVTFDDGYRDVYENAFPMLLRKGIPAAVFVVTGVVGTSCVQMHDRLHSLLHAALRAWTDPTGMLRSRMAAIRPGWAHRRSPERADPFEWTRWLLTSLTLDELRVLIDCLEDEFGRGRPLPSGLLPMTWEMAIEMHRAGMTIGSHTRSHALLTNEPKARVLEELARSRRELEERLGAPVAHFAYPDGRFNGRAIEAVHRAGYRYGYTTCPHQNRDWPLLTIPRRVLWERSAVDTQGRFVPGLLRYQEQRWRVGRQPCTRHSHA